jgi:hypothetical protein
MKKYKMYDSKNYFIRNIDAFSEAEAVLIAETENISHYFLVLVIEQI